MSSDESAHASLTSSPCESPIPDDDDSNKEFMCALCNESFKQPRVLSCLHTFCTACIERQVETDGVNSLLQPMHSVACVTCKQVTQLSVKGVDQLPMDYVMVNALDMSAIEQKQIVCTSCKAKEKAVARCMDCANFLCPNCVTAHQYMRCFENHKVSCVFLFSITVKVVLSGIYAIHKSYITAPQNVDVKMLNTQFMLYIVFKIKMQWSGLVYVNEGMLCLIAGFVAILEILELGKIIQGSWKILEFVKKILEFQLT